MTCPKSCWSIFKKVINNKKIPCIPPLLHNDKFITNFKEKADIFNDSLINTNSNLLSVLSKKTHKLLSTLHFTSDGILKIIKNLDPNKAHGDNMIIIRMKNICDASNCKPLELIFRLCLENEKFPTEWRKANVVPAHKKGDKQTFQNYLPVSLLPVAEKIFERILYNSMY